MSKKPPYPDMADVIRRRDFHGVAWIPTTVLRWVERQDYPDHHKYRVLQQLWETHVINNTGHAVHISNPNYTQWRDVPFVADENETTLPGEYNEDEVRLDVPANDAG